MARFSPIAPLQLFQTLPQACQFGSYHLLLAHEVLRQPEEWKEAASFQRAGWENHGGSVFLLDNSLIELGEALPALELLKAAALVDPDFLILPDALSDYRATVELTLKAALDFGMKAPLLTKFAIVVQGHTLEEYVKCARDIFTELDPGEVGLICVPKKAEENLGSRCGLVSLLWDTFEKPLHLLGWSRSPLDDVTAAEHSKVLGIDSAVPIWWGSQGHLIPAGPTPAFETGPRPKNFWSLSQFNMQYMAYNVTYAKSWFKDPR